MSAIGEELASCLTLFGVKYECPASIPLQSRFHSAFIQIIITQHHIYYASSMEYCGSEVIDLHTG